VVSSPEQRPARQRQRPSAPPGSRRIVNPQAPGQPSSLGVEREHERPAAGQPGGGAVPEPDLPRSVFPPSAYPIGSPSMAHRPVDGPRFARRPWGIRSVSHAGSMRTGRMPLGNARFSRCSCLRNGPGKAGCRGTGRGRRAAQDRAREGGRPRWVCRRSGLPRSPQTASFAARTASFAARTAFFGPRTASFAPRSADRGPRPP
jgi:hypothetical protein